MVLHNYVVFASLISEVLQKFGYKTTILFMQIRGLKTQNFAWEPGLSDSAHPNYDKKSGSQLLQKKKCPSHAHFHEMSLD